MNVQDLINRARRLSYVDSNQYTDAQALEDLNLVYHDIENTIVTEVSEDFFWDYFFTDTVIGQEEYVLPTGLTGDYTSLYKNLGISVKYSTDTDFTKAIREYPYLLPQDLSYYKTNQPKNKPFYHISDKSYFIYPAPTEVVVGGIKVYGIKNLADLTLSGSEADVFAGGIPSKFFHLISLGMLEYSFLSRGLTNEANNARQRYLLERSKLVEYLSDRDDGVYEKQEPNLEYYSK